ncbi:hypothetical protein Q3G72_011480 [Acer saccharum]|nr:hypothetical protein Q3G72_011480 [Acer saccharum]
MEKYLKRSSTLEMGSSSKKHCVEINLTDLPADPGLRTRIWDYHPNVREQVRREYAVKGPCQPREHNFRLLPCGDKPRRFNRAWFDRYSTWLEYSIKKEAVYCLCCYLFKPDNGKQGGGDSFVGEGFKNWKNQASLLEKHDNSIAHQQASRKCLDLMTQNQHIETTINKQTDQARIEYRTRLGASIDCIWFLLRQGLPFRGHDESEKSSNKGNFLELLQWLCGHNENVKAVTLKSAPENLKMIAPKIQRDIGLNQETSLQRASDTRWGSHYNTILRMISMFSSIVEVLEMLIENGSNQEHKYEVKILLNSIETFDFIFGLYLMKTILGVTNELSQTLQKKDQDIVNSMNLVQTSKERLQTMRDDGWDSCLSQVSSFCVKHRIRVVNMDDMFIPQGRSRCKTQEIKNMHHYRVDLFCAVIDMQLQELNSCFPETNTELLLCVACLSPRDHFYAFDKHKLIRLAQFYPRDYSPIKLLALEDQPDNYIADMRSSIEFSKLNGLSELARKMVEKKKDKVFPLVYLLLTLALLLPVATAIVERVFFAMNIVKTNLRNRMGDEWLNDSLLTYVEKDIFDTIDRETIMQRFQNMKPRRGKL